MRLTLRTLLAYLDDVLDPADKEELGKKIESSEFAGDLIHRMRDTMRRLRLSAPQIVGTGMGLDPNTVAEYLDNALSPEQVGDFERICLESDMHLAEVSSSHHVLTMAPGAPAEIDPATKRRMYSIPQTARGGRQLRIEPAHAATTVATVLPATAISSITATAPPDGHSATTASPAAEIPEYLRARGWSRNRGVLIALAALVLLAATVFVSLGLTDWFDGGSQIAAVAPTPTTDSSSDEADAGEAIAASAVVTEQVVTEQVVTEQEVSDDIAIFESRDDSMAASGAQSDGTETDAAPLSSDPLAGPPPVHTPGVTPSVTMPPAATESGPYAVTTEQLPAEIGATDTASMPAASAAGTNPFTPIGDPAALPATNVDFPAPPPGSSEPAAVPPTDAPGGERYANLPAPSAGTLASSEAAERVAPVGEPTVTPLPDAPAAADATTGEGAASATPPLAADNTAADVEAPEVQTTPDLGTYLGGKTVLLRWNDAESAWFRMAPRSAVLAGDQLLALPAFRPKLTLASGIHLDLSGGTRIAITGGESDERNDASTAPDGVPMIDVLYGRVVLLNTANEVNPIRLRLGPTTADVELARNATLAIDIERRFQPGHDPRESAAPVAVTLFAPDGGVAWRDTDGEKSIDESSQWTIADGEMSEIAATPNLPEWIDHEPLVHRSEQLYGAPVIEETLRTDRPADNQLLELFLDGERRRKEVKSLAARSSIHVGLFVPFVEALRDSAQRPNWEKHIDTLRAAMALDPEAAERIWQTLVDKRGEAAAADLYEMLRGYNADQIGRTPEQVRTGAIADLIDRLESDSLDYRVLAVHNLSEITGKRLMPNPAASLTERAQNVRRWRNRLESDELVPREEE
jgi:hypothetical protein